MFILIVSPGGNIISFGCSNNPFCKSAMSFISYSFVSFTSKKKSDSISLVVNPIEVVIKFFMRVGMEVLGVVLVEVLVEVVEGVEGVVPIGNPLLEDFVGDLLDVVAGWIVG